MLRSLLICSLAVPLCAYGQSYADSPFYQPASAIPSTAHVEGSSSANIRANGVVIEFFQSVPSFSPDFDQIRGWSDGVHRDGTPPDQVVHFYIQYERLGIAFGYNLLAQPVEGTGKIKCTFSSFTDWPTSPEHRNQDVVPVALPVDLTPLVIRSGDAIAIRTLPLGQGRITPVHFLRLTRMDLPTTDIATDSQASSDVEPPVPAWPALDLLRRVAEHYRNADTYHVHGTASSPVQGSSWRATYDFDTEAAQPAYLPLNLHSAAMQFVALVRNPRERPVEAEATSPKPPRNFPMVPFGQYSEIVRRLAGAEKIGEETIFLRGRSYNCEVIDAVYDDSPSFRPHSAIQHRQFWVDPANFLILRETRSVPGFDWTALVTDFSFDQPPSQAMTNLLEAHATQSKNRPEWVGRPAPEIALRQLSGEPVDLAELRGKTVLLDFWASFCAPCRRTTLHAQDLQKRYASSGLLVLTLTQDTPSDARLWTKYNQVTLPVLLDSGGVAFRAFEVQGVPVTILINKNGKVTHYSVGFDDPSMDSALRATLALAR